MKKKIIKHHLSTTRTCLSVCLLFVFMFIYYFKGLKSLSYISGVENKNEGQKSTFLKRVKFVYILVCSKKTKLY
jgi:hypothetical protein